MGLYDRDYGRSEERTPWDRVQNPRSITITLIVINVVIFFADQIFAKQAPDGSRISLLVPWFAVEAATLVKPWTWFQFLTYGFLHDITGINHVLFNMIGLFFFGRIMEQRIGRMEFLRFYLVAIVLGGIIGSSASLLEGVAGGLPISQVGQFPFRTIGASGGVVATVILFACYYPQQEILLMFVLLTGAFFAIGYYFRGWNLRWLDLSAIGNAPTRLRQRSRRMKLKLHDPEKKLQQDAAEADWILEKIHRQGESSLSSSERKTLERYSRQQREKRNQ